jgi:hypothetical protein
LLVGGFLAAVSHCLRVGNVVPHAPRDVNLTLRAPGVQLIGAVDAAAVGKLSG